MPPPLISIFDLHSVTIKIFAWWMTSRPFARVLGHSDGAGKRLHFSTGMTFSPIWTVRHVIEAQHLDGGILAGLADEKLAKAITAMHGRPEHAWSLEALALEVGYANATTLTRVFCKRLGASPTKWLARTGRQI